MRSLRSRLIAGTLAGITLVLAGAGGLVYLSVRHRLHEEMDRALETIVRSTQSAVDLELGKRVREGQRQDPPGREFPDPSVNRDDLRFECWLGESSFVRSPSLEEGELPSIVRGAVLDKPVFAWITLEDGSPARAVGLRFLAGPDGPRPLRRQRPPFRPPRFRLDDPPPLDRGEASVRDDRPLPPQDDDRWVELVVAQDASRTSETLRYLAWLLVLSWAVASLCCAAILAGVVHHGLEPLRRLKQQIEGLDEGRLDHRFDIAGAPWELRPVVDQLNGLVHRLHQAFAREQAFTSHAAHELRTPLSGLRSTLEVALSQQRSTDDHRRAAEVCLEITRQMQSMVERLLELAQMEARRGSLRVRPVDLGAMVEASWQRLRGEAKRRESSLVMRIEEGTDLHTDAELFERVVSNLLANAVAYAPECSAVEVVATPRDEHGASIRVANAALDPPADLAERAFDAFWRADAARTETGLHAGLGLALCKRLVEVLGGRITARCEAGRFEVTVDL